MTRWSARIQTLAAGADAATALGDVGADTNELAAAHTQTQALTHGIDAPLLTLINDICVTDIVINPNGEVFVERAGTLQKASLRIDDTRHLAVRLAAAAGRRLDDASPIVDGQILSRVRVHAILAPLAASDGEDERAAAISLRIARPSHMSLDDLQRCGTIGARGRALIERLVAARKNVVVCGATGSGKTTLLAAALAHVSEGERLVVIEEAREVHPDHGHVVCLQAREANVQGAGEVTMSALVRAALRMRPDRLVLGEARGAEIRDVLAAMNTGHAGCWLTLHANAAADLPARLIALGALAAMSPQAVSAQAGAGLDVVVQLARTGGQRIVTEIAAIDMSRGELRITSLMRREGEREVLDTRQVESTFTS